MAKYNTIQRTHKENERNLKPFWFSSAPGWMKQDYQDDSSFSSWCPIKTGVSERILYRTCFNKYSRSLCECPLTSLLERRWESLSKSMFGSILGRVLWRVVWRVLRCPLQSLLKFLELVPAKAPKKTRPSSTIMRSEKTWPSSTTSKPKETRPSSMKRRARKTMPSSTIRRPPRPPKPQKHWSYC